MSAEPDVHVLARQFREIKSVEELAVWKGQHNITADLIQELVRQLDKLIYSDLEAAQRVSKWMEALCPNFADKALKAKALRARGCVLIMLNDNAKSLPYLEEALSVYTEIGDILQSAKTRMNRMSAYTHLSLYSDALADGIIACESLERIGDKRVRSMTHVAVGTLLFRLDRFHDSLQELDKAESLAHEAGDSKALIFSYSNRAVNLTSLNNPDEALKYYDLVAQLAEKHGMTLVAAVANYNRGYLHYMQGEYAKALKCLNETRERLSADPWHASLCDLTQSEIYLELNLYEEAYRLGRVASESFQRQQMKFETAKAHTVMGIAAGRLQQSELALRLLEKARESFCADGNDVRTAAVDTCRAMIHLDKGEIPQAVRLASDACERFINADVKHRAALAQLILARGNLKLQNLAAASDHASQALALLQASPSPLLAPQIYELCGEIQIARSGWESAREEFRKAINELERVRVNIPMDELRMSYLVDKTRVYELMISTFLETPAATSREELFEIVERAKSRTLVELLAGNLPPATTRDAIEFQELRRNWDWCQRRIDEELGKGVRISRSTLDDLHARAHRCEQQITGLLRESASDLTEYISLQRPTSATLKEIQNVIPVASALIEYFIVDDDIMVFVVSNTEYHVVSNLCSKKQLKRVFELLRFQLSRPGFQLVERADEMLQNIRYHLRALYRLLVERIEQLIAPFANLVLVPHDLLHYLPFHAFFDGREYLIDRFCLNYAPSASTYRLGANSSHEECGVHVLIGVSDARTPSIRSEIDDIRALLPAAKVFVDDQATRECFVEQIQCADVVHIASHASFRNDNPMFSAIQLHDTWLNLADLYGLKTSASLVTLSGCGTGLNAIAAGDELLGMVRGFLYAGAKSVLVSLWDVDDRSTANLMKAFYRQLAAGKTKAESLRSAMLEVKSEQPHPVFWAPFILMGNTK